MTSLYGGVSVGFHTKKLPLIITHLKIRFIIGFKYPEIALRYKTFALRNSTHTTVADEVSSLPITLRTYRIIDIDGQKCEENYNLTFSLCNIFSVVHIKRRVYVFVFSRGVFDHISLFPFVVVGLYASVKGSNTF